MLNWTLSLLNAICEYYNCEVCLLICITFWLIGFITCRPGYRMVEKLPQFVRIPALVISWLKRGFVEQGQHLQHRHGQQIMHGVKHAPKLCKHFG